MTYYLGLTMLCILETQCLNMIKFKIYVKIRLMLQALFWNSELKELWKENSSQVTTASY